jgi:hypothetical protein
MTQAEVRALEAPLPAVPQVARFDAAASRRPLTTGAPRLGFAVAEDIRERRRA